MFSDIHEESMCKLETELAALRAQLAAARVAVEALAPYKHTQLKCSPREGCYCGADAANAARTEARRALGLEVGDV